MMGAKVVVCSTYSHVPLVQNDRLSCTYAVRKRLPHRLAVDSPTGFGGKNISHFTLLLAECFQM